MFRRIPNLIVRSNTENYGRQLDQWFQMLHKNINQKHNEILHVINRLQEYIEEKSECWKNALRNRLETKIGCVLMEQIEKFEVEELKFNQARDEFIRAKDLFNILDNQPLIALSNMGDDQMDFSTSHFVFPTIIPTDGLKLIEKFCMEETIECSNQQKTFTDKDMYSWRTAGNYFLQIF